MKRNAGIYLILVSIVVTAIGSVLKIQHQAGADFFLAVGIISFIIGAGIVLFKLFRKNSA
jgi:hypothetical protein